MSEKKLTKEEFEKLNKTFFERLEDSMSTSGCNDLFDDEFPKSICERFSSDNEVFEIWKSEINKLFNQK